MTTSCVLWCSGHFKLCRCQQSAQVWKHRRYSSFITSIWESLLLTSFFTSPKRSIIGNLKKSDCKEGLGGDKVTKASIPHIETSLQTPKSRAHIWVQWKKDRFYCIYCKDCRWYPALLCQCKICVSINNYTLPPSLLYTTYKNLLQSLSDKHLYSNVLNTMKGE